MTHAQIRFVHSVDWVEWLLSPHYWKHGLRPAAAASPRNLLECRLSASIPQTVNPNPHFSNIHRWLTGLLQFEEFWSECQALAIHVSTNGGQEICFNRSFWATEKEQVLRLSSSTNLENSQAAGASHLVPNSFSGRLLWYGCFKIQKSPLFNHWDSRRNAEWELRMHFPCWTVFVTCRYLFTWFILLN